jgi:hypothetical protein
MLKYSKVVHKKALELNILIRIKNKESLYTHKQWKNVKAVNRII